MPSQKNIRRKKSKQKMFKTVSASGLPLGISVLTVTFILTAGFLLYGLGSARIALIGAGLAMPEGSISFSKKLFLNSSEQYTEEQTEKTISINSPQVDASKNDTDKKNESEKTQDITKTPSDIAALIAKCTEDYAKDKKDGNIVETTYGKSNATSVFKNVLVKNTTATKSINIEKVLKEKTDLKITDKNQPAVLIFHTHTSEGYEILDRNFYAQGYTGRSNDEKRNVVRVGTEIASQLEAAGYKVIHDKEIHDSKYTGAYSHSRKTVEEYLKKYPSIQVVLDVHRDAIHLDNGNKIKPVANINGKKAAQIMIITGAEEGKVTDFPDWEYNLRFTLKLQQTAETMYPGLMRPVLFSQRKYNMDLSHCNVLLEMGSDANTLDEAAYSGRLIGKALAAMMDEYVEE
ncbi:MAG: stage II sporulation protein P [Clostridia bacterium]|nr:stage II sporulation protein P [Clostridia bacterium]